MRIGEHVQSFSLQLGDSISALLSGKWSKFEGYDVAMVNGKLAYASGSTVPLLEGPDVELPPLQVEVKDEHVGPEEAAEVSEDITMAETGKLDVATDEPATAATEEATADEAIEATVEATVEAVKEEPVEPEPVTVVEEARQSPVRTGPTPLPGSLFIGDLRLLALKNRLAAQKIDAQFAGEGVLVCGPGVSAHAEKGKAQGSMVVVRKLGEGQVALEGAISRTYFAVRKELYGSYAQVTAM